MHCVRVRVCAYMQYHLQCNAAFMSIFKKMNKSKHSYCCCQNKRELATRFGFLTGLWGGNVQAAIYKYQPQIINEKNNENKKTQ